MTQVTIEADDGTRYSMDVEQPDPIEKMHIAADAPEALVEAGEEYGDGDTIEGAEIDFTPDVVDYLVDVATRVTELEEGDLRQLTTEQQIELCAEILNSVFEEDDGSPSDKRRRVKRVRLTREFITHLFRGEMTMVAGLPDDATFEEFNYDPARMELQFVFSSDEWEPIAEGAEIPVFEAACVEIPSSTKEL